MNRRLLPRSDWPENDRSAFEVAFEKGDIFRQGRAAHWATASQYAVMTAYGRWIGFLAECEPSALKDHPVERLSEDLLLRYIDHLAATVGSAGRCMYLANLRLAVRVIFHNKTPPILDSLVGRLKREYRPRPKTWVDSRRLTELGIKLMKGAIGKNGDVTSYIQYRDGLMIMLLSRRPVRRRALAQVRIGKQLRRVGDDWRLVFEAHEMKSGRPFEITVPEKIVPFLERFLREVRPMFLGADHHDALWLSSKGRPLIPTSISRLVAERTRRAFGDPIPPHRFRHSAASTIAVSEPSQIQIASGLLDHASLSTTNDYYNLARSIEASRTYAKILSAAMPRTRRHSPELKRQSRSEKL